ncbi:MAG: cation diffusion facilitator family transporter [Elusimicrobia bacterium]|nr:cation diffusion facilitator family transporter [Elusimicrobiota bacterium]
MAGGGTSVIVRALIANAAIAAAKGVAAAATGSGALLAETIHSASDCANQGLLLLGLRRARKPATESHPLGYGRALYFWSFLVALLLFTGGGLFSLYEGAHKLLHPEPIGRVWLGVAILGFSLAVEGWAFAQAVAEVDARRGGLPLLAYLRASKDSDLIVVFGEDLAALLGLGAALGALLVAQATGNPAWDAAGTVAVGVVLIAVAVFLAVEVKSLLIGESADPAIVEAARRLLESDARLRLVDPIVTLQQGPGEVLVALKLGCAPTLPARELSDAINAFEKRLRAERPEVRWIFAEPDLDLPATSSR